MAAFSASSQTSFFVAPHIIDTGYDLSDDSNFVSINTSVNFNNKLFCFFDGSGSNTKDYQLIPQLAANLGYHAVSVAYPNLPSPTASCTASADSLCYDNFRQELCYGTPVSDKVSIDTFHCIYTRMVKLLQYLIKKHIHKNGWEQFLSNDSIPVWSKFVMAGHSQGSGHALYFGKTQHINRVLMFSGVTDYSDFYNKSAHWIYALPNIIGVQNYYGFLHLRDEVLPFYKEYDNEIALGMTANGDDSTLVDNAVPPYNNSHCFYILTNVFGF